MPLHESQPAYAQVVPEPQPHTPTLLYLRLSTALCKRLPDIAPSHLAALTATLKQLLPPGADARPWRPLCDAMQQQCQHLSPAQLCEALPLCEALDLALPQEVLQCAAAGIARGAGALEVESLVKGLIALGRTGYVPVQAQADAYLAAVQVRHAVDLCGCITIVLQMTSHVLQAHVKLYRSLPNIQGVMIRLQL